MECRDRYFMIAVKLSFTGENPQFEAIGKQLLTSCNIILRIEL